MKWHRPLLLSLVPVSGLLAACGGTDEPTTLPMAPSATVDQANDGGAVDQTNDGGAVDQTNDGGAVEETNDGGTADGDPEADLVLVLPTPTPSAGVDLDPLVIPTPTPAAAPTEVPTATEAPTPPPTTGPIGTPPPVDDDEGTGEPPFQFDQPAALLCANAEFALDAVDAGDQGGYETAVAGIVSWRAETLASPLYEPADAVAEVAQVGRARSAVVALLEACVGAGYQL